MRIATGTGRTGNDMRFARSAAGFLWCVGEGLCPSRGRPQGSPLRKGYKECDGRADVGIGPYGSATRSAVGGPSGTPAPTEAYLVVRRGGALPLPRATARVAPTKALQGVRRGERNPPVTASPCQPPLGKGAGGTGAAECHTSDIGHWFAMTEAERICVSFRDQSADWSWGAN